MPTGCAIERDAYFDSVMLMRVAARLSERPDVMSASLMMGTEANKRILRDAGLLSGDGEAASANDLIIAIAAADGNLETLLEEARGLLESDEPRRAATTPEARPRSLAQAVAREPADIALISTPGVYAAAEAMKALRLGLHVFLFSDNVAVADEVALKREGRARGRLVMGPDCGTAIVDGVPLGFANAVRPGGIGLIGASGTGLQQVSTLIDGAGHGVSQVIGVGGRDLSEAVGGASMLQALDILADDAETLVIVLISKPPADHVAARVLERAAAIGKPAVACFIGAEASSAPAGVRLTATLEEAALAAVELDGGTRAPSAAPAGVAAARGRLRALYSGGTFAYEARSLLAGRLPDLRHELEGYVPGGAVRLPDADLVLDLGDDAFTVGRPHPMIDPTTRVELLRAALADDRTGVVLLDVVLGHGAAADPAGPLVTAIREAGEAAPSVVAFVVGTDADPQDRGAQEQRLRDAGALVVPSSTAAARLARDIRAGEGVHEPVA